MVSSLSKNMIRKSLLLKTISYFSIFCFERKMSMKIWTMNKRSTSLCSEIDWFFIKEFFLIDFMYSSNVSLSSSFAYEFELLIQCYFLSHNWLKIFVSPEMNDTCSSSFEFWDSVFLLLITKPFWNWFLSSINCISQLMENSYCFSSRSRTIKQESMIC